MFVCFFFFSSRRRHTRWTGDWSSDVCSSDLNVQASMGKKPVNEDPIAANPANAADLLTGGNDFNCTSLMGFFASANRSEERRVGKECRSRWAAEHEKKKKNGDSGVDHIYRID